MKQVPTDAPRLPAEVITSGRLDVHTGHQYAWTDVQGTATSRTQTEDGMSNGQTIYEITFQCPRCEDTQRFHTTFPSSSAAVHYEDPGTNQIHCRCEKTGVPVRCYCDATLVYRVTW